MASNAMIAADYDDTILWKIAATLAATSFYGPPLFDVALVFGSRVEAEDHVFTAAAVCAVIYETTDTVVIPDLEVGCILHLTVMVAVKGATPTMRGRNLTQHVNAVRNALNTNIPSEANGFGDGDEYHPRMRIDTPVRDDETASDPWAIAWLPVEVAYRTTTRTTH